MKKETNDFLVKVQHKHAIGQISAQKAFNLIVDYAVNLIQFGEGKEAEAIQRAELPHWSFEINREGEERLQELLKLKNVT